MRRSFRTLSVLVLAAVAALAWAQEGGTLTIVAAEEPDTLDPQKTSTAITGAIMRYAGDTLLTKDLDNAYADGLASSWSASEDGLTWTFELKPGATFHDGSPLDAEAVRASILRAKDPATQSPIAGNLFEPVETIEVVDADTLRITLDRPFAPFLDNLTDPRAAIVNVAAAQEMGDDFGRTPVLSGPWRVAEWVSGDRIVLERNPDYAWGPSYTSGGAPSIERIVFRVIPESATQVAALETGEVDVLPNIPPTDVERLRNDERFNVVSFLRKGVGLFLEFNTQRAPFDDLRVRQALNYAIDPEVVLQVALRGLGQVAHGVLPPSIWGYWEGIEDYDPGYDPERALELLAEAGWTRSGDGPLTKDGVPFRFTLFTAPIDTWTRSAQIVQAQLAEIGIDMQIQTYEFGTLLENLMAGEHDADFMGYTYTNPDIVQLWFHSSNIGTGLAHSHFPSEELDALIEASRTETDEARRLETYAEIQRYISDQALWVPLWTNENFIAMSSRVSGAVVHPEGFLLLNDATLE
ncbi:MAG TPA: ABC transporter substrate-binding protein [Trueperaceae bacterium]